MDLLPSSGECRQSSSLTISFLRHCCRLSPRRVIWIKNTKRHGHARCTRRAKNTDLDVRDLIKAGGLDHLQRVLINLNGFLVDRRDLRHEVHALLALLLLELQRDATHGTTLDALHQMGRETGNLVAKLLRSDERDLLDDLLVDLEVEGETRVVCESTFSQESNESTTHEAGVHFSMMWRDALLTVLVRTRPCATTKLSWPADP
jgi:hypothetical protein